MWWSSPPPPPENVTPSDCGSSGNEGFEQAVLPPVYAAVFVVGSAANVWALRSVWRNWREVGRINVFLLNLGAADLLYLSTLPLLVAYYARGSRWELGAPLCKLTRFCFNLNLYGSIGFVSCISLYRYLAIVHPMRLLGRIRRRHSLALSAAVWLAVVAQISPDLLFDKNDAAASPLKCFDTTSDNRTRDYLRYSLLWSAGGFGVPSLVVALCYGHVALLLLRARGTGTGTGGTGRGVDAQLKARCLRLVLVLMLLYALCFVPYHVLRNLNLRSRVLLLDGVCGAGFRAIHEAHQVGRCLACLNAVINPLLYVVADDGLLRRLQQAARRSLRRLSTAVTQRRRRSGAPADSESERHPAMATLRTPP